MSKGKQGSCCRSKGEYEGFAPLCASYPLRRLGAIKCACQTPYRDWHLFGGVGGTYLLTTTSRQILSPAVMETSFDKISTDPYPCGGQGRSRLMVQSPYANNNRDWLCDGRRNDALK